jgi:hypothetical protein
MHFCARLTLSHPLHLQVDWIHSSPGNRHLIHEFVDPSYNPVIELPAYRPGSTPSGSHVRKPCVSSDRRRNEVSSPTCCVRSRIGAMWNEGNRSIKPSFAARAKHDTSPIQFGPDYDAMEPCLGVQNHLWEPRPRPEARL